MIKKTVKKLISDIIDSKLILNENSRDIVNIYSLHYNTINDYLKTSLLIHGSIKFSLVINIMFTKVKHNEPIFETPFFRVGPFTIISEEDFNHSLYLEKIHQKIDTFNRNGSGWVFEKVLGIYIDVSKYLPIQASCSFELPDYIKNKKAVLNIKNVDNQCFKWCILAYLHPVEKNDQGGPINSDRVSKYEPFTDELNFQGIEFPVSIHQIPKFEKQNNISVSVFSFERKKGKTCEFIDDYR